MSEYPCIRIALTEDVTPDQLAAVVLGCQTVLALAGLDAVATIWPDEKLVTDEQVARLADEWADRNPWS
ncbi:MAG TPA: hypothetical protein VFX16_21075 [Pseudonocardiaceae bacterium]|nr:hypothetical protein [Pseudonocardiaceae bacterium]